LKQKNICNTMNKSYLTFNPIPVCLLLAMLLLALPSDVKATHAAGSDLTYTCLGGNQYQIDVTFYRDCAGVAEPNNITLTYKSASCGYNLTATATKIANTGQEITIPCQSAASTCTGGANTGIRKFVYRATITLPAACTDWKFSYQVCCRNCAITTISDPCAPASTIYVEATLNNLNAACNSSPTFSNIPIVFTCLGQLFNYNQGMMDANGDSLAYELITPKTTETQNVNFIPPHSQSQPILSSTPFTLNPITGQLTFTPSAVEIGILAIRVKEYRNGLLIGTTIRDMQVYVTACPNSLPTASGINNTNNFSAYACPNQQLCFTIYSADADAAQNVTLTHNNGIAGATYTISAGNRPTLQFCWTPTTAQISSTPYMFTVTVQDNACPTNGAQVYSYNITVPGPNFTVSGTNLSCFGNNSGSASTNVTTSGPNTYLWSNGATTSSVSSLAAGTYTVTVTHSASGCTSSKSVTLTQPTALSGTATVTQNVSCFGGTNGSVSLSVSGGTGSYSYLWNNGATSQNLNNVASGNYTVTITDANGCTLTRTAPISQPAAALSGSTSVSQQVSCYGGSNGSVSLTVSGGTPSYSYLWNSGATTQNISGLSTGSYTVTITDANGCTITRNASVSQPAAALNATISASQNVSCNSGSNGSVNLSVSGGTIPYSYLWSNGATTQNIMNLSAGAYTVTITDANGCTTTKSQTITQPAAALSSSVSSSQNVSCFGIANGSINLSVNGGTPAYSFLWSNSATTQNINNLSPGNYSVTVTDANGCTSSAAASITQPSAALSLSGSSTSNVNCFGNATGSITLNISGGTSPYTFNWSNGSSSQNLNNISAGTYTVTVTDANGCALNSSYTISQPSAALSATSNASQNVSCFGGSNGSVQLTVSGGTPAYSYAWSNGASSQNISGLNAGIYTVTVTDSKGCTVTQSQQITQPSASLSSSVSSFQNVSCYGGSNASVTLAVAGGTTPYSFLWSNGATSQNLSNVSSGTYSVTVTDANSCTSTASVSITQPAAALSLSGSSSSNVDCYGNSTGSVNLNVSGGTTPYSFNWSNGASTQNLNNISAGTYTVTVTDVNGCIINAFFNITQPSASLTASASSSQQVSCNGGTNGSITLNVSGGTPSHSFQWSNGATTQNISGLSSGTYTVTVTDANGCITNASAAITQPAGALGVTGTQTNINCYGNSTGAINLTSSGGTTPYSYLWSNGSTSQNQSGLSSGFYAVTVTDANGCTSSNSFTLTQPSAALSASAGVSQNVSCNGGSNGSVILNVSGGTSPHTFNWSNGSTSQNLNNVSSGTYTVTVTDSKGCTATQSATVTQPSAALSGTISVSQNVSCFRGANGSINLNPSGGTSPYVYSWSNGSTSQNLTNLSSGTYTVTITDANGCTFTSSASVSQPAASLSATATVTQNVSCNSGSNGSIAVSVSGGTSPYSYNWSNGATSQNLSNLSAGTYTVTVTDANGCTSVQTKTVTQPAAALSASVSASQNVSCHGGNNGSITLSVSGGTSPYSYQWSNGASSQNLTNIPSGAYTVTVTDANGCIAAQSVTISQPAAALSSTATATSQISCFGGSNGSINLNVNGGTTPYSYLWSNGSTSQNQNNLSSGTYTVTITDANGCTANNSATVTQPAAALSASTAVTSNISCFSGNNGSIDLTVSGGTSPYTYIWNTGATTQDISGVSAGTYTVSITDANGCTKQVTDTITQPAGALSTSITVTQGVLCYGGNNGSIDLTVNGGTAPYAYIWSNGATTEDIQNLSAGNYTATITDQNGCSSSVTGTITQPNMPINVSANVAQQVSCHGGSNGNINLTINGGTSPYTFSWSNGSASQNQFGLSAGTYTVTVTDANGCTELQSASVTQPAASLSSSVSATQNVSCYGGSNGSITLTVNGGTSPYSYNWSNGATTQNLNNISSGTYNVTITDANGCVATQSATITQPSGALNATLTSSQNVSCYGGANGSINVTVIQGTSPYTFNWNNGATTEDISNLSSGNYTVTVTDANGCTTSLSASIQQPAGALNATVSSSTNVSCFGGSNGSVDLTVTQGTSPYAYNWSNGATSEDLNNVSSGTYTVTVTDANGCTTVQSASVGQPAAALSSSVSASQNVNCHSGSDGSITLSVNGGTSPYTFNWSNGATTQNLSNLSAGTYAVTITDANGCTANQSATITQPSASLASSISAMQNVNCFAGSDGSIDLTVNGGTVPYSFNWSNGATTEDISNLSSGNYTVTVTDANGCTAVQSASISQPGAALSGTATVTSNISCFSGNNGSIDLTMSGGTTPYNYLWSTGATSEDLNNLAAGTYTVTVTDNNGCTFNTSATISQPPGSLTTSISISQNVSCFGGNNGSIDLTASSGTPPYTFQWSNGETTEDISNLSAGTYTVTVTDANGCFAVQSGTINQPTAALSVTLNASQNANCFAGSDGSIDVTVAQGTSPYTYIWSNGESTEDISNLAAGTYTVTVTDANGCTETLSATISQPSGALSATLNSSQNVNCFAGSDGQIDLTVTQGTPPYTYNWNNGETTEDINNLPAGTYTVIVTDANGCTETLSATITQPAGALSLSINPSQNVSCFGGANGTLDLTVTMGTAPYTFNWSNGDTTEDIINLSAGTYTVTVTDANGCTETISETINQPQGALSVSSNVTQQVSCFAGSNGEIDLTVAQGTPPYTFNWSNGATSEDIAGLAAGTYTVTVTDSNGCFDTHTVTITQPQGALSVTLNASSAVSCFGGNNGMIDLTVNQGTPPYSYNWSNGETTEDINSLAAGTYTVTVTDANGCTETLSATITQPSGALSVSANATQNVGCFGGNDGSIDLTVTQGTPPYTFNWSNGETTEDISNLSAGTYTVTVTDTNGCTATYSANITQPQGALTVTSNVTSQVSCFGGSNGAIDLTVSNGTPPYSYLWNTGATTEDISNLSAGIYTVTVTDVNNCSEQHEAIVSEPTGALNASLNVTQSVSCYAGNNGSIDLTVSMGTPPYAILWSNGATTEDISNLAAGTYTVMITDANGCTFTDSVLVSQPAGQLNVSATASQQVSCNGGSNGAIDLTVTFGTAPYSFVWSNGATTEDLSNLPAGIYTVTVTDANGCTAITTATIFQPSASLAVSGNSTSSNCLQNTGGTVSISATGGTSPYTYLWNNGATSQNLSGLSQGNYSVTVTDANGCTAVSSYTVSDVSAFNANANGPTTVCVGELVTMVADSIPGATYQWYLNGQTLVGATYNVFVTPAAGNYTVTINHPCGTYTSDTIRVTVNTIASISVSPNVIICPGESTQLTASGGVTYTWIPYSGLDYSNVPNPIATPDTTTTYQVEITNEFGCKATGEVLVTVLCDTLIIPSGYSPNDDGVNDGFVIKGIEHYPGNRIWIYNRWGNMVFKAKGYKNEWNGISNVSGIYIGKKVPNGTYYYVLDLNNGTKPLNGYVVVRQ